MGVRNGKFARVHGTGVASGPGPSGRRESDMINAKIEQAVGILNELDIDVWMTFVRESLGLHDPCIDLVVGGNVTWQSAFIITRRGERIAILGSLDKAAHETLGHYPEIITYVQGIGESLRGTLARLDPRRIAINFSIDDELADGLSYGMYLLLQNTLRGTPYGERLVSSEGIVSRLRSRKLEPELARITHACEETVDLFAQLHKRLKPGMTEKQIAAVMVAIMEGKGLERAWDPEHCPAVFTGPESAGAHAGPTDRRMEPGHLMNVDFGMRYQGFCSDLQRTWYCLRPKETQTARCRHEGFQRRPRRRPQGCRVPQARRQGPRGGRGGPRSHRRPGVRGVPARPRPSDRPERARRCRVAVPGVGAVRREAVCRGRGGAVLHPRAARPGTRARGRHRRGDRRGHKGWLPFPVRATNRDHAGAVAPDARRAAAGEVHMKLQMAAVGVALAVLATVTSGQDLQKDVIPTSAGDLQITFVGHGTLMLAFGGKVIHVDPFGKLADYSTLPKADLVLDHPRARRPPGPCGARRHPHADHTGGRCPNLRGQG